jgi:hypothetical protein
VIGQLGLHPPLQDGLDHLWQEAALTGQRHATLVRGRHQPIEHLLIEQLPPQPPSLGLVL